MTVVVRDVVIVRKHPPWHLYSTVHCWQVTSRERKKTITDRFQLHDMIFCFIEARQINATIIILRVGSPLSIPHQFVPCVHASFHKAKPWTLSQREESDGFRSHLVIPYHLHSLFRTLQERPPETQSSLHTHLI